MASRSRWPMSKPSAPRSRMYSATRHDARRWAPTPGALRSKSTRSSCKVGVIPSSTRPSSNPEARIETVISRTSDPAVDGPFGTTTTAELKRRSVRGGVVAVIGQGLTLVLQMCTAMVLARLLSPEDFGLQGMVFAMTGFLGLFREGGLGVASVQRQALTHEQTSTLFWVNVAVGSLIASPAPAAGPGVVGLLQGTRLSLG